MSTPNPVGSRDKILERIREGLQLTAPERHLGHGHGKPAETDPQVDTTDVNYNGNREQWLPDVPDDLQGRIDLFEKNSEILKTSVIRCSSAAVAGGKLSEIAASEGWKSVATHHNPVLAIPLQSLRGVNVLHVDDGYDKSALESVDVGITACESLIAQTGSILISAISSGGRGLSVLPPHHIVIANTAQIVRDLEESMQRLRIMHPTGLPRFFSFITGPSRTGDIERILVLGAHGPKRLTVLLIEGPASESNTL